MKTKIIIMSMVIFMFSHSGCREQNEKDSRKIFPVLQGPYLGQKPPGMTPELFATGMVRKDNNEILCGFFKRTAMRL